MKTRRGTRKQRRGDPIRTSADVASSEGPHSKVAAMTVERAVTELGIHASLSDIVAKAQVIENRILQSRSRRKPEQMC